MKPWGRLTLQSGNPRMGVDVSSNVLYYTPFENNDHCELSLSLTGIVAGNLYDVYLDGSTLFLTLPWSSATTPSAERSLQGGLYFDGAGYLYLGTIYAAANDIVKWQIRPPAASYGCNNDLGVFNAYNRLPFTAINRDSNTSWVYANSGLRYADNSNLFRINWVDGIGDVFCEGCYETSVAGTSSNPAAATVGVGLNQNAYPINWDGALEQAALNNNHIGIPLRGTNWTNGLIGRNNWQAMEQSTEVDIGFFGNNFACLTIKLSI